MSKTMTTRFFFLDWVFVALPAKVKVTGTQTNIFNYYPKIVCKYYVVKYNSWAREIEGRKCLPDDVVNF